VTNCLGTGEAEALRLSQGEFVVTFTISAQCLESVAHFILVFLDCLDTEALKVIFRRGLPEGFMGGLFLLACTVLTALY